MFQIIGLFGLKVKLNSAAASGPGCGYLNSAKGSCPAIDVNPGAVWLLTVLFRLRPVLIICIAMLAIRRK